MVSHVLLEYVLYHIHKYLTQAKYRLYSYTEYTNHLQIMHTLRMADLV